MNHQELKDLLPLYVLGGLEAEFVAAVEQHLAEACDSCTAELREWREVVGLIPLGVTPAGPRPAVKERLMARVQQDLGAKVIPFRPQRKRAVWVAVPLAAAAAVVLVTGGLRYQDAMRRAAEQTTRAETVAVLLAQAKEDLASREMEFQRLTAQLDAQQAATAEKAQAVARLEASLTEQRRLVSLREQELAHVQQSLGMEGKTVTAKYEREIAGLKADLIRQRDAAASNERELNELRVILTQQRALVEANERETTQLRDALARQRGVIEVLTAPGLRVGYLRQAKSGVPTEGHVLWNERKKAWLFYAFGMPPPPPGKEYQVWFMTEKEGPVSAGLFTPDQSGTGWVLATPPSKLFGDVKATAVTLEPAGGLQKPSGEMYLRGSL
jgi:anti-sigma-K factor RskA